MNEPAAFINGDWIPASEAAVSVDDAGFVLGASVAEQLRTFAGKLFRLDAHLARLAHSLEIVGIDPCLEMNEIGSLAEELAARNHRLLAAGDDLRLSIVITPGTHPAYGPPRRRPLNHAPANLPRPTVCLHTHPLAFHLWADQYRRGVALRVASVRQVPASCWPPALKCRSRMHYYLADRQAAAAEPCARALLLDADGFVTEASTANLLIYRAGEGLLSPPAEKILPGISLSAAVELARGLGIPCHWRDLTVEDVADADEAMLTSTSTCIVPVASLDGRPISAGRPGKVFRDLLAAWGRMTGVDVAAQAERYKAATVGRARQ